MILRLTIFSLISISLLSIQCQSQKVYRGINTALINDVKNPNEYGASINKDYFKLFSKWNVNVIRVLFRVDPKYLSNKQGSVLYDLPYLNDFNTDYYKKNFQVLDTVIKYAKSYDIKVIIYLAEHIKGKKSGVFYNPNNESGYYYEMLNIYKVIAEKYKDNSILFAYDPLSEPKRKTEQNIWKEELFEKFYNDINSIDNSTYILFAPGPVGMVEGFEGLIPFTQEKVLYSIHCYYPVGYTHQGIKEFVKNKAGEIKYPGDIKDKWNSSVEYWDKEKLINSLKPALEFKSKYNAKFFVGEFGVVRWAPDADLWINDVVSILEANNISWTYFSYGGINKWNPTFDKNDPVSFQAIGDKETIILKTLQNYWQNN